MSAKLANQHFNRAKLLA